MYWSFHSKVIIVMRHLYLYEIEWEIRLFITQKVKGNKGKNVKVGNQYYELQVDIIQIMHIREVVGKNYSPRGNFIKV